MLERPIESRQSTSKQRGAISPDRLALHCACAGLRCISHGPVDAVGEYFGLDPGARTVAKKTLAVIIRAEGENGDGRLC